MANPKVRGRRSTTRHGTVSATCLFFLVVLAMSLVAGCAIQLPKPEGADQDFVLILEAREPAVVTGAAKGADVAAIADPKMAADAATMRASDEPMMIANSEAVEPATASSKEMALTVDDLAQREVLITYNGEVVADKRVAVIAEAGGMALIVNAAVGDQVKEGDVLVQLDATILEAQRTQALYSLQSAQASLELLMLEPSEADIEAAEASVAAAIANYNSAVRGPDEEDIRIAQANLQQAERDVRLAQSDYNEVRWRTDISSLSQSLALEGATLRLEAAQASFAKATRGGTEEAIAGAYAQIASARANLARLTSGPEAAEIRAAQLRVQQAETDLYLAQLRLDKTKVLAPINGIITSVDASVGSMVGNGSPVVTLISDEVRITIPVEENRMDEVVVGQAVLINVDAHPDHAYAGEVELIAPELDPGTRTVQVTIRPTGDIGGLAPGMFAVVDLLEE